MVTQHRLAHLPSDLGACVLSDRVANMPGLGKEEMGMLTGLCAGMDGALEWLETYLQGRYNCIDT